MQTEPPRMLPVRREPTSTKLPPLTKWTLTLEQPLSERDRDLRYDTGIRSRNSLAFHVVLFCISWLARRSRVAHLKNIERWVLQLKSAGLSDLFPQKKEYGGF